MCRVLAGVLLLLGGLCSVQAATISVDSTADDNIVNGNCTLREAVIAANTNAAVDACTAGSGADVIAVPEGTCVLTLVGAEEDAAATGDVDVTTDVEIQGVGAAGTIIDGNASDRVLDFDPSATGITAQLSGVTVRGGVAVEGGGIRNGGTLTVADTTVTSNSASSDTATDARGGGIRNSGSLTLTNSTISDNSAVALSMMFMADAEGGGIYSDGSAVIVSSTIAGNTLFSVAFAAGGGVGSTGTLTISATTISDNDGFTFDGPAQGGGIASDGVLTLTNSTISANSVDDMGAAVPEDRGGGLYLDGTATISNCAIADNSALFGGAVANQGTATFRNTIVAGNPGGNCDNVFSSGTIVANAYNLDSGNTCTFSGTDLVDVDPLLGPLQDNGGPTFTHALLATSPALEAGNPAVPGSGGSACEATDQRGVSRPQRVRCDIGSFESEACPAAPLAGCTAPEKSLLLIKDRDADGAGPKDKLIWKWLKGPATMQAAFGDPTATADYALCIYAGTAQALTMQAFAPAGGTCGSAPCWSAVATKGYRRKDAAASTTGLSRILLKGGSVSSKILVKGKDANLDLSPNTLPLDAMADVVVQLSDSDNTNCWASAFPPSSVKKNVAGQFRAKIP